MRIERTDSSNPDFAHLCRKLDEDLYKRYGKEQSVYDAHNTMVELPTVLVGYLDNTPVSIGCFRKISQDSIEIKRMYVHPSHRRNGLSLKMLSALESWGEELGCSEAVLETGKGQPEAIGLYTKAGYIVTENYGPYIGMENSVCMKKILQKE